MLRTCISRWALPALLATTCSVATASADPVTIVEGSIVYSRLNTASIELTLARGWLRGEFGNFSGEIWTPAHACFGCVSGSTINTSLSESFPRPDAGDEGSLGATMVWDGVSYNLTGLSFTIDAGDVVVPPLGPNGGVSDVAQFTLRGLATGSRTGGGTSLALLGIGKVRVFFETNNWLSTEFRFEESAAVPEPGTMLLFASGAAAVLARRRRRLL